ncbi:hypothetical protein [Streptomyces sp. NPDC001315]|uniref:hypothetical protein n=1 Tax=Streptomyces sp. NPDC001315 TaxID=3364562 RepID=UPI0036CABB6C
MKSLKALRLTLPVGLAALMLTAAGSMSTASAATHWVYRNAYENNCLTASTVTDNVWSGPCNEGPGTYWYWGSESTTDYFGVTFHRLVSLATGDCLTTDAKTDTNAVWMSPCGSAPNQWWNGDGNNLETDSVWGGNYLRTSANGDAVYTTPYTQAGIEPARWTWYGTHN